MSEYTADFALICEGVTDHAVLTNILFGFFKNQRPPRFTMRQPDLDATGEGAWQQFGNWENVFRYLREGLYEEALQFNEYLIIQIDTDASEHPGFGVPQQGENGRLLEPAEMVARVINKLRDVIGPVDCAAYAGRMIFAICVREIECWLLPLWADEAKKEKTEGCLKALKFALGKKDALPLNKEASDYIKASIGYRKLNTLLGEGRKNPSLKIFLDDLQARNIALPPLD